MSLLNTEALDRLACLRMICRRGREYLNARLADPALRPDTESTIAEWLSHVWLLAGLKEYGLYEENAELVQLTICVYDDVAREEFVDLGAWVNLGTGMIGLTKNYGPYQAVKFIREHDSFFRVMQVPQLFRYPGNLNPRIRWGEGSQRDLTPADCAAIREKAAVSLAEVDKTVRNQLWDPLADRNPWALVRYRTLGRVGEPVVLKDAAGERIALTDTGPAWELPTVRLLSLIDRRLHRLLVPNIPFATKHATRQENANWAGLWKLKWVSESEIALVEAVFLGETVELAAAYALRQRLEEARSVKEAAGGGAGRRSKCGAFWNRR